MKEYNFKISRNHAKDIKWFKYTKNWQLYYANITIITIIDKLKIFIIEHLCKKISKTKNYMKKNKEYI